LQEFDGVEVSLEDNAMSLTQKVLSVLDVGSSGNFFKKFEKFDIIPIDISPSDDTVFTCDFLSVPIEDRLQIANKTVEILPSNYFHAVIFCLLLEYLPSSAQRIKCCEKAYKALKTEGILIIITPDSSHEMKNSKQIKNWRWTLSKIGFTRIKLEKLINLTCMAFRKNLTPEVPRKWAESHRDNMEFKMEIPQDKSVKLDGEDKGEDFEFDAEMMQELPQFE
jgi:25S rRNA (adenine2142-N1)-methyltransferase